MRWIAHALLALALLAGAGCDSTPNGSAYGRASERGGWGHARIGFPF
jgi:hypothetical protein